VQHTGFCDRCGLQLGQAMKLCPSCGRLVFADELNRLAGAAEAALQAGQNAEALANWRHALELLPESSIQATEVRQRIDALVKIAGNSPVTPAGSQAKRNPVTAKLGMLGVLALAIWKFKWLITFFLTKGKLLLFGLTKLNTIATMVLAVGAYATLWGWKFALGFVVIMYIHEMGHVFAIRQLGMKADAPIFLPGVGAFVRMRQKITSPVEDAIMGLAGPLWGLAAAVATSLLYLGTDHPFWAALTHVGALLNLFNLLPIGPLDGSRGLRALSTRQRGYLLLIVVGALFVSERGLHQVFLIGILLVGGLRAITERATATTESWLTFVKFVVLIAALTAMASYFEPDRLGIVPGPNGG
jgi:Zn-dependent protease